MSLFQDIFKQCDKFMHLKMYIDAPDLLEKYTPYVARHNDAMLTSSHPDAGFDLFTPVPYSYAPDAGARAIHFQTKCSAKMVKSDGKTYPTGFYLYPRSSLSKTPLRLANSVGIIDSGYRGNLVGMFYNTDSKKSYKVESHSRLAQICGPELVPIIVELVSSESDLGMETDRGIGGFGSTGR